MNRTPSLRQDPMDNFSVNVGEAEIATGVAMGEVLVIEAE
jgi:hypothetical protein